jgi:pimeloyl-ACP methyl ester carboxylesterase
MRMLIYAAALAGSSVSASAQTAPDEAPPAELAAKVAAMTAAAEAGGEGPFKAEMVTDPGLPTHTIYRPRDMAAASRRGRLPILAWGNGACTNMGNRFRYFLTEIASSGYVVIAVGPLGPRSAEWKVSMTPPGAPPPPARAPQSFSAQLTDAIDWALAENNRRGSPYYHRLDASAIAVAGQSCGGLQAVSAAADRRVKTAMVLNSGTFPDGTAPLGGTGDANKASLNRIHVPVAWISGDDSDIAHKNAGGDFAAFSTAPALWAWHSGTGHSEHYREVHGGLFTPVATAWLDWQLKGSRTAGAMFTGADCRLCKAPGWNVQTKGMR